LGGEGKWGGGGSTPRMETERRRRRGEQSLREWDIYKGHAEGAVVVVLKGKEWGRQVKKAGAGWGSGQRETQPT